MCSTTSWIDEYLLLQIAWISSYLCDWAVHHFSFGLDLRIIFRTDFRIGPEAVSSWPSDHVGDCSSEKFVRICSTDSLSALSANTMSAVRRSTKFRHSGGINSDRHMRQVGSIPIKGTRVPNPGLQCGVALGDASTQGTPAVAYLCSQLAIGHE